MFADFIDATDTEAREVRFRMHDDGHTPVAAQGPAEPFDIAFDGGDFTLSNCVYRRGPVTKEVGNIEGQVIYDGTQYIAVWIDSEAGTGAAHVGATIASVTDAAVNYGSAWYKVLLYKIEAIKTGEGEEAVMSVRVVVDYRTAQAVVLYI